MSSSFSQFKVNPSLAKAIQELGFETPTPVQTETLPILLGKPTDFLGLAATGTGKTAAFAIPLLEKLKQGDLKKQVQGLVLCPTRELAKQVAEQINLLARYQGTKALAIYGGSDYSGQLRALKEGVSIVVGTPGRIIDHLERGTLVLNQLKTVILDEADEMISMGFKEEIELILSKIGKNNQHNTWLFSATMSKEIRKIADQFLHQPAQVSIAKPTGKQVPIRQFYFEVHEDQKTQAVQNLIGSVEDFHGLVFCQTKNLVIELTQALQMSGINADCLHGDMDQSARERSMKAFKTKKVIVLVCTDVAARGIDVKDLTHVINYSLPRETENYVHRIGRTGRGGKEGIAWNLVNPSHRGLIPRLEQITQTKMTRAQLPSFETLLKLKMNQVFQSLQEEHPLVATIKPLLKTSAWKDAPWSPEELIARMLAATIKIAQVKSSIYQEPRRKEGSTRADRRRGFLDRTQKSSHKPFVKGKSRPPRFKTFAPKKA